MTADETGEDEPTRVTWTEPAAHRLQVVTAGMQAMRIPMADKTGVLLRVDEHTGTLFVRVDDGTLRALVGKAIWTLSE